MKLKELIDQLQKIENARPGMEVGFQSAEGTGNGFSTEQLKLLHIHEERDERTCWVSLGNALANANEYKEHLKELQKQGGAQR